MSTLICGSIAYDTIMVFPDQFKSHIMPDKIHILNVSFLVPDMRREFGGCAGNITFNLHMLGGDALPMATVGQDFTAYAGWMDQHKINRQHIQQHDDLYTAQAFITTDMDDNQITAFHPGAMNEAHQTKIADANGVTLGIVAPNGRQAMIEHAADFAAADIPFVFDPGQGLPMFEGDDLKTFIDQASYVIVNDYESQMIQDKTSLSASQIAGQVDAFIETLGGEGARVYAKGKVLEIPTAKITNAIDPTGCGDAFRGGLLYGLAEGMDWSLAGRLGSLMGGIKIEKAGTQNHAISRTDLEARFKDSFGMSLS